MAKIFGTDGVRGVANKHPMTAELALQLGRSAAYVLKKNGMRSKVVIGKDTRISCYMIENALASGINSMGMDVLFTGPIPTPAIAFLTRAMRCDLGVMISASHNPYYDNGIKFFSHDGFKLPDKKESEIEELVFSNELDYYRPTAENIGRAKRIDDAQGRYIEFLKNTFPKNFSLDGLKIVIDCANGATYKVAPTVLFELGADVEVIGNDPNGLNINDGCGSTDLGALKQAVKKHKAHVGIAYDGDGDRAIFVDEKGHEVDGDAIMAICARDKMRAKKLSKNTVVATVMSNMGLEIGLAKFGIKLKRTQVGDRYVVEELRKHNYNFGGEQSGHIIFLDNTTTGDGILSSLKILAILIKTGERLSDLSKIVHKLPQVLVNVKVKKKLNISEVPRLHKLVNKIEENLKGKGRILVRHSGTEPKLRIMLEGENKTKITKYANEVAGVVKKAMG